MLICVAMEVSPKRGCCLSTPHVWGAPPHNLPWERGVGAASACIANMDLSSWSRLPTLWFAALDLDWTKAFPPLDTDGQGYRDGHINLSVESVQC